MFLSPLFREAFVNTIGARLELYDTDGAKGAALGAGVGAGIYGSFEEAFKGLKIIRVEETQERFSHAIRRSLWPMETDPEKTTNFNLTTLTFCEFKKI